MGSTSSARFVSILATVFVLVATAGVALFARDHLSFQMRQHKAATDKAAIELLHQLDVAVTLTDKADELAKEWDSEAVRIQPGRPAEIGKAAI